MTQAEIVYAETLNIFGSSLYTGPDEADIQDIIDSEHARADRAFAFELAKRLTKRHLSVS